jgi:arachidonate 5-lipoxygenase
VSEMSTSQSIGGCGIGGIPEKLDNIEQLVEICTVMISTCSMGHAAVNYQQYETYGFPPNYPALLMHAPPKKKVENSIYTYFLQSL